MQILTTRNIEFVSGPSGRPANPNGYWSVVGNIRGRARLMLAKDETIVVIPIHDVKKIANFGIQDAIDGIRRVRTRKDLKELKGGKKEGKEKE